MELTALLALKDFTSFDAIKIDAITIDVILLSRYLCDKRSSANWCVLLQSEKWRLELLAHCFAAYVDAPEAAKYVIDCVDVSSPHWMTILTVPNLTLLKHIGIEVSELLTMFGVFHNADPQWSGLETRLLDCLPADMRTAIAVDRRDAEWIIDRINDPIIGEQLLREALGDWSFCFRLLKLGALKMPTWMFTHIITHHRARLDDKLVADYGTWYDALRDASIDASLCVCATLVWNAQTRS